MFINVGRIVLDFYNNDNVALKRRQLTELCDGLRRKFNISALEVASFDDPERCVLGFAAVAPETWTEAGKPPSARGLLEKICKEIDDTSFARVMLEDTAILSHGDED